MQKAFDNNPNLKLTFDALPPDLREYFFSKYMNFAQYEIEMDETPFVFPVMLLILQFVNTAFYRQLLKENSVSRKAIFAHRMRDLASRGSAARLMMEAAARQFGSITLIKWLENFGFKDYAAECFTGAVEGNLFLRCNVFLTLTSP